MKSSDALFFSPFHQSIDHGHYTICLRPDDLEVATRGAGWGRENP